MKMKEKMSLVKSVPLAVRAIVSQCDLGFLPPDRELRDWLMDVRGHYEDDEDGEDAEARATIRVDAFLYGLFVVVLSRLEKIEEKIGKPFIDLYDLRLISTKVP
jgi:hypothetical protein